MSQSRVKNSMRNVVVGVILQIVLMVASLVSRTIFIKVLGEEYLGVSGLYSNILSLLSLADMGISTAFVFSLYAPLANKDYDKIAAYLNFYKKIFRFIALSILVLGLFCVFLLPLIINDVSLEARDLKNYFILSVINTAVSYLAVYKSSLIKADQKEFIVKIVHVLTMCIHYIVTSIILIIFKEYYLSLIISIVFTLLNNIVLTIITNKLYPEINHNDAKLDSGEKKSALNNIVSLAIYRVGGVLMNSTDNILISILLGTVIVGYYMNYVTIINIITTFIAILSSAVHSGIGNFIVKRSKEEIKELYHGFTFLYYAIGAFCSACFLCVFNDFIFVWLQDLQYLISFKDLALIIVSFYITCISNPNWMFRETLGLFKQARFIMLICAIINILLSIILGKFLGLGGIILATGLSKILTMFWIEPRCLYKEVFKTSIKDYWFRVLFYLIQSVIVVLICCFICSLITSVSLILVFVKIFICVVISGIILLAFNFKNKDFILIVKKATSIFNKKKVVRR